MKLISKYSFAGGMLFGSLFRADGQNSLVKLEPVNFSQVNITDNFWKPKIDKVAVTTLAACIYQTETVTPRLRNFEKVARGKGEQHEGIFYDDSDVFKALEAMSYSLKAHPDPDMQKKCDKWIDIIAAAQLPDGYLNTYFTLHGLDKRWTDMSMHEDYNAGHMIEAAVAYYDATGKRKFLDVVIKWADYFDSIFGPNKRDWVTGHQELELALVKLYRVTRDEKYLSLAHWLLEERGHRLAKGYTWTDWKDTAYAQDLVPLRDQSKIMGHAVRAMYMYTGAADVAALTGDMGYVNAMRRVWEDVVYRNMYITGGIGSSGSNEGFSENYDLPNSQAYCETCASVGMVFWNQRMNELTGKSEYVDVLEKCLYNGALDGLSLSGDHFFYGNPLASAGKNARREWFGTACCPANIARLVESLGNYIYGKTADGIWINLFVGSNTIIPLAKGNVEISMETNYPWEGRVKIHVNPVKKGNFSLHIRVPGWVNKIPSPGGLYRMEDSPESLVYSVNGKTEKIIQDTSGYAVISRVWNKGDLVEFEYKMTVEKINCREEVKQDKDRVALQRGPLIYCVEGADNNGKAWNFILPAGTALVTVKDSILSEQIVAIKARVPVFDIAADGLMLTSSIKTIKAIPYYTWCNRGSNEMQVWLPTRINELKLNN
jgi:uncharacterized protein